MASLQKPPRVFISYSWDTKENKAWVAQLAARLIEDGIEARLEKKPEPAAGGH